MADTDAPTRETTTPAMTVFKGMAVAPGIAIGPAYRLNHDLPTVTEYCLLPDQVTQELNRFEEAHTRSLTQLTALQQRVSQLPGAAGEEAGLLMGAHAAMLQSSRLVDGIEGRIRDGHQNADAAVRDAIREIASQFDAMGDSYLAARADDVREVGARLIRALAGRRSRGFDHLPEGAILLADEITPADTALMDPDRIAGFAGVMGGAESHTAIMARALGLPAVLGVAEIMRADISPDSVAIVDGLAGKVILDPDAETLDLYTALQRQQAEARKALALLAPEPAVTRDGLKVRLMGNADFPREAQAALQAGAEGLGLVRTEYLYMNRHDLPAEDELFEAAREMVLAMNGRPITFRTLDIGGEKQAPAFEGILQGQINPALGLRGIRLSLAQPEIFTTQIRALLRASVYGPIRILLPMISHIDEVRQAKKLIADQAEQVLTQGQPRPPVGIMIETPAAALSADQLVSEVAFMAIGSNDLTQYTIAIDRGDEHVADLYDGASAAVMRLIQFTSIAARKNGIEVSVCGELAGDPRLTPLLLGLGLTNLSMAPPALPLVKQSIRSLDYHRASELTEQLMLNPFDSASLQAALREMRQGL
ncbi:MAG: phosphoenolpyruvate--protein phosphotransferase [Alphaproteobacteria bacterium]